MIYYIIYLWIKFKLLFVRKQKSHLVMLFNILNNLTRENNGIRSRYPKITIEYDDGGKMVGTKDWDTNHKTITLASGKNLPVVTVPDDGLLIDLDNASIEAAVQKK